jgi:hypothetical protein
MRSDDKWKWVGAAQRILRLKSVQEKIRRIPSRSFFDLALLDLAETSGKKEISQWRDIARGKGQELFKIEKVYAC